MQGKTEVGTYSKKIYLGKAGRGRKAYVTFSLEPKEKGLCFSMQGEVYNAFQHDIDMGGQCLEDLDKEVKEWVYPRKAFYELRKICREWHLNDMKPGAIHQRPRGWDNRLIDPSKPL